MRIEDDDSGFEHMHAGGIDPIRYGALVQQVKTLQRDMTSMKANVEELLALANKSKGGLWAGMMLASAFGGIVEWVVAHLRLFGK